MPGVSQKETTNILNLVSNMAEKNLDTYAFPTFGQILLAEKNGTTEDEAGVRLLVSKMTANRHNFSENIATNGSDILIGDRSGPRLKNWLNIHGGWCSLEIGELHSLFRRF